MHGISSSISCRGFVAFLKIEYEVTIFAQSSMQNFFAFFRQKHFRRFPGSILFIVISVRLQVLTPPHQDTFFVKRKQHTWDQFLPQKRVHQSVADKEIMVSSFSSSANSFQVPELKS
jgi:hypothetical protein